jgi:tetratricopeptide (TPR) repeat protein
MALALKDEDAKAAGLLEQACAQDPPPDEACLLLAQIKLEAQKFDDAIAWLSKGFAADQGNLLLLRTRMHAHLSRATSLEKEADVAAACDAAIRDGEELLRLSDKSQGHDARARARATLGHHQMIARSDPTKALTEAVALWTEIAERESSAAAWREIADIHEDLGLWREDTGDPEEHFQAALAALDRAAALEAPDTDAWITRGEIHKHRGRAASRHGREIEPCFREAVACIDKAIDANPAAEVLWEERADVHWFWAGAEARLRSGDVSRHYRAAHGDLEQAIQRNPSNARLRTRRAHLALDWIHLARGDAASLFPAACQDIDAAIAKEQPRYDQLLLAAEIRFRWALWKGPGASSQELLEQSIALLDRAVELDKTRARAFTQRADARGAHVGGGGSRDQLDVAIRDANEALRIQPDSPDALRARGVLQFMSGRYDEALPDLEKAVKLEPRMEREMKPLIDRCRER